jgi:hypothetical protein
MEGVDGLKVTLTINLVSDGPLVVVVYIRLHKEFRKV